MHLANCSLIHFTALKIIYLHRRPFAPLLWDANAQYKDTEELRRQSPTKLGLFPMENTDSSAGPSPSDLELAVSNIQQHTKLVGYRNLLSYASALGVKVFPKTSFDIGSWTQIGSGSYSTTWRANIVTEQGVVVAVKQPNASFTRASTDVENNIQHKGLANIIQELQILANTKLQTHPNLPHVLGVFFREEKQPDGIRPCVIFDLATSDLRKYLSSKDAGGISPSEMTRLPQTPPMVLALCTPAGWFMAM